MPKRSDIEKLKSRAADLRKIAERSSTRVGRHVAEQMATEAEQAAIKVEAERGAKH